MNDFPIALDLRLDWSEMDLFGHINNVSYFKYVQASRVHCWEVCGLAASFSETKTGPILRSTTCEFLKPLHFPGNISVRAKIDFVKNTSFGIHHRIYNEQGELCAEAADVIVWFDFNANSKTLITNELRIELTKYT